MDWNTLRDAVFLVMAMNVTEAVIQDDHLFYNQSGRELLLFAVSTKEKQPTFLSFSAPDHYCFPADESLVFHIDKLDTCTHRARPFGDWLVTKPGTVTLQFLGKQPKNSSILQVLWSFTYNTSNATNKNFFFAPVIRSTAYKEGKNRQFTYVNYITNSVSLSGYSLGVNFANIWMLWLQAEGFGAIAKFSVTDETFPMMFDYYDYTSVLNYRNAYYIWSRLTNVRPSYTTPSQRSYVRVIEGHVSDGSQLPFIVEVVFTDVDGSTFNDSLTFTDASAQRLFFDSMRYKRAWIHVIADQAVLFDVIVKFWTHTNGYAPASYFVITAEPEEEPLPVSDSSTTPTETESKESANVQSPTVTSQMITNGDANGVSSTKKPVGNGNTPRGNDLASPLLTNENEGQLASTTTAHEWTSSYLPTLTNDVDETTQIHEWNTSRATNDSSGKLVCLYTSSKYWNRPMTATELKAVLKEIKILREQLLLNKSSLLSFKMKKISATDDRMSSKGIGAISALVVGCLFAFIVISDVPAILRELKKTKKRLFPSNDDANGE